MTAAEEATRLTCLPVGESTVDAELLVRQADDGRGVYLRAQTKGEKGGKRQVALVLPMSEVIKLQDTLDEIRSRQTP